MNDILCLGEPLVEFNQLTDGNYLQGFGGDVSNVAIAAARQSVKAGMLTRVGADKFGEDLLLFWRKESVSTEHVVISKQHETGIYFVRHDDEGHHFIYRRKGSAASTYSKHDLPKDHLEKSQIFYASGISLAISQTVCDATIASAKIITSAGGLFAFDPNLRTALWPLEDAREAIHNVMELCDIALPSLEDARKLTGLDNPEDIVAFYHDLGPSTVALTLGDSGSLVSDQGNYIRIPPIEVQAVDATGAGDCFNGTFLAALIRGVGVFDAGRWANVSAALSTQGFGVVSSIPTLDETRIRIDKDIKSE